MGWPHPFPTRRRHAAAGGLGVSIQAVAWVLEETEVEGLTRLVLLALANHADHVTGECWPTVETVAREARCSRRTVFYALNELVSAGLIEKVSGGGRGKSNRYRLRIRNGAMSGRETVQSTTETVQSTTLNGAAACTQNHQEPSRTLLGKRCTDGTVSGATSFVGRCDRCHALTIDCDCPPVILRAVKS